MIEVHPDAPIFRLERTPQEWQWLVYLEMAMGATGVIPWKPWGEPPRDVRRDHSDWDDGDVAQELEPWPDDGGESS